MVSGRASACNRIASGESYVAGGTALNELLRAPRLSRDIGLFHDTQEALAASWSADRGSLEGAGHEVVVVRERPTFVEALVRRGADSVVIQWTHDSAYRFFPLVRHEELGLVLHPFDPATGTILALVGRVEPRDFIDTLTCDRDVQPLGYLAWAACGKDPGFSPAAILDHAARTVRYTDLELGALDFQGIRPRASELSVAWHAALARANAVVGLLPAEHAGTAVLTPDGDPFRGDESSLMDAMASAALVFHQGRIRGAFPRMVRRPT